MNKIFITLGALLFVVTNAVYVVDQTQYALVIRIGKVIDYKRKPGLYFKIPYLDNVEFFDNRVLDLNADPREIIAGDRKRIIVDAFTKYRIVNPKAFRETVRNERGLVSKLEPVLDSSLRQVIGRSPLISLLTDKRAEIMKDITDLVNKQVSGKEKNNFGIEIVDVRIMRADLPKENSDAIYQRMQTERHKEARQFRAEGDKESKKIKAGADKSVAITIANANKQSEIIRGQADSEVVKIFADSYSKDEEFFEFLRTMNAYQNSFKEDNTTFLMSLDNQFLKRMEKIQ